MIYDSGLHLRFWVEATQTIIYTLNSIETCTQKGKTSFKTWTKEKPFVIHMKVFGCDGYVHVLKELWKKLNGKSVKGVFMAYNPTNKAYCLWLSDNKKKIDEHRDITFNEEEMSSQNPNKDTWSTRHVFFKINEPFKISTYMFLEQLLVVVKMHH
jgi:hypothetical protein